MKTLRIIFVVVLSIAAATSPAQSPTTSPDTAPHDSTGSSQKTDNAKNVVFPGRCYETPMPPYTKEARKAGFQGTIQVKGTMKADGALADLKIVNSPGLGLDDVILKALKNWKCRPATDSSGKQVETKIQFDVKFE